MFMQKTDLGRTVKIEDWLKFHRDRLVSVLYSMWNMGDDTGLTLDQVRNMTGLTSPNDVSALIDFASQKPKLVTVTTNGTVAITDRGIRWVDESPKQP
jgi:hypothetical protein